MIAALLLVAGCYESTSSRFPQCDLDVVIEPASASAGAVVSAVGGPLTEVYDTRVTVGGLDAEVLRVERTDCTICDACREEYECGCSACGDCASLCETCVEVAEFEVPALDPGVTALVILNRWGASPPLPFEVLPPEDTGAR